MPKPAITFDKGWLRYKRALNPSSYTATLKRHVGKATERNGLLAVREVRREIRRGVPPTNALLTRQLKGGGKPLVGTSGADLFNAVTSNLVAWHTVVVGVKRMTSHGGHFNVAEIVHEGAEIKVTPAMRTMFRLLFWASEQYNSGRPVTVHLEGRARELWMMSKRKRFYPLKDSTTTIVIPPRPFFRYAFRERSLHRAIERNWADAVNRAIRHQARSG